MSTTISVRGRNSRRHRPERAIVRLTVQHDGPERQHTLDAALSTAAALRTQLENLRDSKPSPLNHWSSEQMHVWGDRPWNQDGKQLPLVYHATLGFFTEWNDFAAMSEWVVAALGTEGVTLNHVEWKLTEATTREIEEQVRRDAVADALSKARTYAKALGLNTVVPHELADVGLLQHDSVSHRGVARMALLESAADTMGGPGLSFEPEDIDVVAEVDARFLAD